MTDTPENVDKTDAPATPARDELPERIGRWMGYGLLGAFACLGIFVGGYLV